MIAVLGPDEFFGEGCLTGQVRRLSTASTMTECEIMRISKPAMLAVLREEPKFSELFMAHVLARALLLLANFGSDGKPQKVIAKVSQETLAKMVGTTRSRVSHS